MKKILVTLALLCLVTAVALGIIIIKKYVPADGSAIAVESMLMENMDSEPADAEQAESGSPEADIGESEISEAEAVGTESTKEEAAEAGNEESKHRENGQAETEPVETESPESEQAETETAESGITDADITETENENTGVQQKIQDVTEEIGLKVDNIAIDLPNVEKEYELLFINDMHILTVDDTVVADYIPVAQNRYDNMFRSETGTHSSETWMALSSVVDDWQADAVLFGGDMMDFVSPNNVTLLQNGLEQIETPYMYLRADHDLGTWYSAGLISNEDAIGLHQGICAYEDMYVMDFGEFYVLGWNNSTGQMTENGLQTALEIWDDGKPIILATHVPITSAVDTSLAEASANVDPQGRTKLWGDGCLYQPQDYTCTFLGMLYDSQSPVKAVLSGHLHFKHTVPLTDQTMEYVFAPAFAGNIAKIKVY